MKLVTEDQLIALVNRIKDKFAKKDTGWYNITALVAMPSGAAYSRTSPKVLLRRIDNTVYLAFSFFGWNVSGASTSQWLPLDICKYVAPPMLADGQIMQMGGSVMAENRTSVSHYYSWVSATNFKINQSSTFVTHGLTSWITDTPFPTNPKGVKI